MPDGDHTKLLERPGVPLLEASDDGGRGKPVAKIGRNPERAGSGRPGNRVHRFEGGGHEVALRFDERPRDDAAGIIDGDRGGRRIAELEAEGRRHEMSRPQSEFTCSLRPASGSGIGASSQKSAAVDPLEQQRELLLVRRVDDEHAAPLVGRKALVVEIVAVHRDERAPELLRQPVVLHVGRAAERVFLDDEQHVPLQPEPHVGHEAGRHVGVGIDPRPRRQALRVRRELG